MSKLSKIGFFGNLIGSGTDHGYGYAAVELIRAWQRQQVPVWWGDTEAPIGFQFIQPVGYDPQPNQINIGYTPWESTRVPEAWLFHMKKMDEVWTTSYACKEWYENAGIEVPVRVLHHGLNREHFPNKKRIKRKAETFKFLHIGEPTQRKGGLMVYQAFKELYGNNPEFKLVLKGKPSFDIDIDNVVVIDIKLHQEELLDLYHRCHAFLYPTNGEGFGLLPFQAAATGMPTLVTDWGGCKDFMDFCWPLEVEDIIECDYEPHEGQWALPSYAHMLEWMQWVTECYKDASKESYTYSKSIDRYWSWDYQATVSLNWFRDLLHD